MDIKNNDLIIYKIGVFFLLVVCRLLSGLCPFIISKKVKKFYSGESMIWVERIVNYSMDFSGGILLATIFIHMIPEVREQLIHTFEDNGKNYKFPFAELLVCIGFFIIYVLEDVVKYAIRDKTHGQHHHLHVESILLNAQVNPQTTTENGNEVIGCSASYTQGSNPEYPVVKIKQSANNKSSNSTKHLLLVFALSFHSVMEGLAIGLAVNIEDLWYLFLAVMLHECTILLCVGIEMIANCTSTSKVIRYMSILALISPAGMAIGTVLTSLLENGSNSIVGNYFIPILQGLASGTILYVTFFEVLNNHKHHHSFSKKGNNKHHHDHDSESGLPKLAFIAVGFIFMVALQVLVGHTHIHEHHGRHEEHHGD